jgi:hypothetical protein
MKPSGNVATLIERYFTERLMRQRVCGLPVQSDTFKWAKSCRVLVTFNADNKSSVQAKSKPRN